MVVLLFIQILKEHSVKQKVETLIRDRVMVAPDLGLRCLPMFHKKYARLIRVDIFKLNVLSYPYIIGQAHFLF